MVESGCGNDVLQMTNRCTGEAFYDKKKPLMGGLVERRAMLELVEIAVLIPALFAVIAVVGGGIVRLYLIAKRNKAWRAEHHSHKR